MSGQLPRLSECHEPIRFVQLDSGKAMPVNPRPGHTGSVCARLVMSLSSAIGGKELRGFVISKDRPAEQSWPYRFVPHYATCSERTPAADPKPAPAPDPALF